MTQIVHGVKTVEGCNDWMEGKTEASINFVREAEEYLHGHSLEEGDAVRLERMISLIKAGRIGLTNHQSIHEYLHHNE